MGELAVHADAVLGDSLQGVRQGRAEPAAQSAARSCYSGSSGPCVWFGSISCHRLPLAVSIPVPSFTHPPVRRGSRDVEGARVSLLWQRQVSRLPPQRYVLPLVGRLLSFCRRRQPANGLSSRSCHGSHAQGLYEASGPVSRRGRLAVWFLRSRFCAAAEGVPEAALPGSADAENRTRPREGDRQALR